MVELRSFQKAVYGKWVTGKFKGILKAVPGSGKTLAALEVIKQYDPDKTKVILVVVPSKALFKQWTALTSEFPNTKIMTIHMARKSNLIADLLVIDEIHRTVSEKNKALYTNVKYNAILGMSATPNKDCAMYAGQVIQEVGFDQALDEDMISKFNVTFHLIDMNPQERVEYERLTHLISQIYRGAEEIPFQFRRANMKLSRTEYARFVAMQRRAIVYEMKARQPYVLELLQKINSDNAKKILIFTQRIEQAETLSRLIPGSEFHHSKAKNDDAVARFRTGATKTLVTVRTLTEGFDVPDIDVVIVMSTAITESYHIQTLGRAIRKFGDKAKEIHILLGKGTSDEDVLAYAKQYRSNIVGTPSVNTKTGNNRTLRDYYEGEIYSIDHRGGIFKNNKNGRQYYDCPPELSPMVQKAKRTGGRFTIGQDGTVRIRDGANPVVLGKIDISKIKPRPDDGWSLNSKKLSYHELFNSDEPDGANK